MRHLGGVTLLFLGLIFSGFTPAGEPAPDHNGISVDTVKTPVADNGMLIDAKRAGITGDPKEALSILHRYVNRYPSDPVGHFELAQLESARKNYNDALVHARKASQLDPSNPWYKMLQAEMAQLTGNLPEAITVYEQLSAADPSNMDYCYQLASLCLQQEKYSEALKIYDRIEQKTGVTEEMSLQKQKIYLYQNDLKGAEKELKNLAAAFPAVSRYLSILAEFYMANNMPGKALETYKQVKQIDPENPYIHMSMADYYRKTGDNDKAYEELKLGFANPNLDIDTKVTILLSFYSINQIYNDLKSQAFTLSEILTKTHPSDPKAWSIYGDLLAQDKQLAPAREAFERVLSLDSGKYAIWGELLRLDIQLSDYPALASRSRRAIDLFPDQPLPYLFNGLASFQLKDYPQALKSMTNGAKMVVDNPELEAQFYMYIGDTEHALNNDEAAYKAYDKSLKLKENNAYVLNNYAYYLSVRGKDLDRALSMAKKAVTMEPDNNSFQDTYGWALYKTGNYASAKEWIEKALKDPDGPSAEVLEHYGDVLFKLGNAAMALEFWIRAKEKGDGSALLEQKIAEKRLIE